MNNFKVYTQNKFNKLLINLFLMIMTIFNKIMINYKIKINKY